LLAVALAACGGGGGDTAYAPTPASDPTPPAEPEFATDYQPSGTGNAAYRYDSGGVGAYSWTPGRVRWGDSVEHHRVRDCDGEAWYWIDGYSPASSPEALSGSPGPKWPVETVRAEWINVDVGTTQDISRLCGGGVEQPNGQPYLPNDIPRSGHFRVRVWGRVWDAGVRGRPWFWQADFTFGLVLENPCWKGAQSTRRAFETLEVWWERGDDGKIAMARGTLSYSPFIGDTPMDPGAATYTWAATNGKDAGPLWTFESFAPPFTGCLQSSTLSPGP
jgi:hypothetical protein